MGDIQVQLLPSSTFFFLSTTSIFNRRQLSLHHTKKKNSNNAERGFPKYCGKRKNYQSPALSPFPKSILLKASII